MRVIFCFAMRGMGSHSLIDMWPSGARAVRTARLISRRVASRSALRVTSDSSMQMQAEPPVARQRVAGTTRCMPHYIQNQDHIMS